MRAESSIDSTEAASPSPATTFSTLSSLRLSLPSRAANPPRVDPTLLDDEHHEKVVQLPLVSEGSLH